MSIREQIKDRRQRNPGIPLSFWAKHYNLSVRTITRYCKGWKAYAHEKDEKE